MCYVTESALLQKQLSGLRANKYVRYMLMHVNILGVIFIQSTME